jgi:3-phenylpropionate/trans-cinnamate dioxygenase ferredoxin reductase subunit
MDEQQLTVAEIRSVGENTFTAAFEVPAAFTAYPGQLISVSMADSDSSESSFYTISSPGADGTVEIVFDAGPDSELGRHLADSDPGTTVSVAGPTGETYYKGEQSVVALAGGPGLGAAIGIGERALAEGHDVAIVYEGTPVCEPQLQELSTGGAHVDIVEGEDRLAEAVSKALETVDGSVMIYGYDEFIERATDALTAAGEDPKAASMSNYG